MRSMTAKVTGLLLAALVLSLGMSLARDEEPAPARGPVVVTYYFLPG